MILPLGICWHIWRVGELEKEGKLFRPFLLRHFLCQQVSSSPLLKPWWFIAILRSFQYCAIKSPRELEDNCVISVMEEERHQNFEG